jgi:hypothetical protein
MINKNGNIDLSKVFLFNCIVKFTSEVMQAVHHYRIRERKGTQQIYNIFIIIFACLILLNTHLYLFDCARRTNLDQEWCLIERKRKKERKLDTLNQVLFLVCEFNDRLDRCSCDIYARSLSVSCFLLLGW